MSLSNLKSTSVQLSQGSGETRAVGRALRDIHDEFENQMILILAVAKKTGIDAGDLAPFIKHFEPYPEGEHGDRSRSERAARLMHQVNQ